MHRDTKVGLALGVLLVGVVAAFFFRHDDSVPAGVPRLADPASIDSSISERDVVPYLADTTAPPVPAEEADEQWRLPDFLQDDASPSLAVEPFPAVPVGSSNAASDVAAVLPTEVTANASGGQTYVVQSGDTLSGIASKVLGSAARFDELYEANRDVLESPDRLRLGQRLRIPNGRPVARIAAEPLDDRVPATPVTTGRRVEETSPETTPEIPAEAQPSPADATETIQIDELGEENDAPSPPRRFVPVRRSPYTGTR